jgi:hypothetical protein
MFALPHIDVQKPIEVNGMAVVSLRDERLRALTKKHRRFAMYITDLRRSSASRFGQACSSEKTAARSNITLLKLLLGSGTQSRSRSFRIRGLLPFVLRTLSAFATPIGFHFSPGWSMRNMKASLCRAWRSLATMK